MNSSSSWQEADTVAHGISTHLPAILTASIPNNDWGSFFSLGAYWWKYQSGRLGSDLLGWTHLFLSRRWSISLHCAFWSVIKTQWLRVRGESWELLECLWVNYYLYSPLQRGRKAASLSSGCTDWQQEGLGWSFHEHREQLTSNKPRNILSQEWSYECVACQVLRKCPLKQHSGSLNIEIGFSEP